MPWHYDDYVTKHVQ